MKQKELMTLITGGENEGVEFKSAFGDAVIEALVAFANTSGGKVLVGVDDRGNIPGIMMGNAIIHRDYRKGIHSQFKVFRDKIVFWNIGKLPEELTIDDLYKGTEKSIPRNIKVAEIFKEAFLIERYGSGIKRAVKELTDYKLPVPKIVETAGGIEIVIYGTPQEKREHQKNGGINGGLNGGINGGLNILCEYIKNNPGKRITEISSILQKPESTLEKQAKKLKDLGKITYKGSKKKGGYYVTKKGTG